MHFSSAIILSVILSKIYDSCSSTEYLLSAISNSKQNRENKENRENREKNHYEIEAPGANPLELFHGTTTIAMVFEGGIIAAVDSRASMGAFVGSSTTEKLIPVSKHIVGTMAGGAADCVFWLRMLANQIREHEGKVTVKGAARMLANMLHDIAGKGYELSIGTMLMGYDEISNLENGCSNTSQNPSLYFVDNLGTRIKGQYFAVGSGSTFAYGIIDTQYKYNMTLEEAANLGRRAVQHAIFRDAASGGYINVYHVNSSGVTQISRDYDKTMLS